MRGGDHMVRNWETCRGPPIGRELEDFFQESFSRSFFPFKRSILGIIYVHLIRCMINDGKSDIFEQLFSKNIMYIAHLIFQSH